MRTNNAPISILAAALAASQLQAFVVPEVALATWGQDALNASAKAVRTMEPWSSVTGPYPGTKVRVTVTVTATQECGQLWVTDSYMTDELAQQGFSLVTEGIDAPQSLSQSSPSMISVAPRISDDGKVLGFTVPHLLNGQQAGISYYLVSSKTRTLGNATQPLTDWITEKSPTANDDAAGFKHLGPLSMTVAVPMSPQLNVINYAGDATAEGNLTVSFDAMGGCALDQVIISKRSANSLMSQVATPTRDGYRFDGWFFDSGLTQAYTPEDTPTHDFTLYAKWVKVDALQGESIEQHPETDPNQQPKRQSASGRGDGGTDDRNSADKGDLLLTGADQTAAVIVTSASVIAGLSVLVLKTMQRQ